MKRNSLVILSVTISLYVICIYITLNSRMMQATSDLGLMPFFSIMYRILPYIGVCAFVGYVGGSITDTLEKHIKQSRC